MYILLKRCGLKLLFVHPPMSFLLCLSFEIITANSWSKMVSLKQISMCIVLWIRTEKLSRSQILSPYPSLAAAGDSISLSLWCRKLCCGKFRV
jgi:hypothetical protein